jgi:hypothetical protein
MNTVPLPSRDNKHSSNNDSKVQLMSVVVDKTVDKSITDLILDDLKKLGKDKCPSAEYLEDLRNKYNTEIILRCDSSNEDLSDNNVLLSYSISSDNSAPSTTINVNTSTSSNNTASAGQGLFNITISQNTSASSVSSTSPTFKSSTKSNSLASTSSLSGSGGSGGGAGGGSGVAKTLEDVAEDTKKIHEKWKRFMQNKEPRYHFIDGMGIDKIKKLSVKENIKTVSTSYKEENKKDYPSVNKISQARTAVALLASFEASNSFNWLDANGRPLSLVLKRVIVPLMGLHKSEQNDEDIKTAVKVQ